MPGLGRPTLLTLTHPSERFHYSKQTIDPGKTLQHKTWRDSISGFDHVLYVTNKVTWTSTDTTWSFVEELCCSHAIAQTRHKLAGIAYKYTVIRHLIPCC